MAEQFEFIVVGGGTAGSLIANRLASSNRHPKVLLIEVGGEGASTSQRNPYERYLNAFIYPELEHGYKTVPQKGLNGRVVPYERGKGLGGSSALNFMIWTPGSAADFDRWAELVGDDDWGWEVTKQRLRRVENFHRQIPAHLEKYAAPKAEDHGDLGPIDVSLPEEWEKETRLVLEAAAELKYPLNPDLNSGDPIGFGIAISSFHNGLRTMSASANLLGSKSPNLIIWTNSRVSKIMLDHKKAIGVEMLEGRKAYASSEVILSAGAIDTPKILLLSGIGPAEELVADNLNIRPVHNLPGVGKKLQDHCGVFMSQLMDPEFSSRAKFSSNTEHMDLAKAEWAGTRTGPFTHHFSSVVMSFIQDPKLYNNHLFNSLPASTQHFLQNPAVPSYEILFVSPKVLARLQIPAKPGVLEWPPYASHLPTYPLAVNDGFLSTFVVLMNPQSEGQITLESANPTDAPLIDFGYMTDPYDRAVLIQGIRQAMKFPHTEILKRFWRGSILVPESDSDDDVWEFIVSFLGPLWHANGSVKMGRSDDEFACVDSDLKVFGISNLRVADLSVCPLTPSSHTQSTTYLIGQAAAEKIIREYGLDK